MEADGAESQVEPSYGEGVARFAPGTAAPTAKREVDQATLDRMAAGRAAWNALPKSERARQRAAKKAAREEKQAKKDAKAAAKEAERAAKEAARAARRGGAASVVAAPHSSGPDTVRSSRLASDPPPRRTIASPPPPPSEPALREPMAVGPVKGLLDLVATMPDLGDGTCFIQVTRVKPMTAFNVPCAGVQAAIWEPVDDGEFQAFYGGAEYTLRGYKLREKDGRPVPITEPVQYKVPGPPNLESAATPDEEPPMQRHQQPNGSAFARRAPVLTPQQASAEAEIHDRDLTHRETMDEREERRRKEREERAREAQRAEQRSTLERERLLVEAKDREAERLQAAHERQLEAERTRSSEIAEMFKAMAPRDDGGRAAAAHAAEIRQLGEAQRAELLRVNDQHREEINRLLATHADALRRVEDQAREDRKRADDLLREAERRAQELIRQVQSDSDRRIQESNALARAQYDDLRLRGEERVRDLDAQWQRRFDDLKAANDRELRGKDSEINMMRSNLEGNQQVILAGKDAEIKRLHQEVRAAKEEAERNKDWRGKMKEITETAEELGFVKAGEGEGEGAAPDFKTFALQAGMQVLQNLPNLLQSGANVVAQMRGQGAPQQPQRQGMRPNPRAMGPGARAAAPALGAPQQAFTFATEDGPAYAPPPGALPPIQPSLAPPPLQVAQEPVNQRFQPEQAPQQPAPMQPMPVAPLLEEPMAALPAAAAVPAASPTPAAPVPPTMAPNPAAPPSMPPPSIQPPSVASPSGAQGLDEQGAMVFANLAPDLSAGFQQRVPPQQVAEALLQQASPEMLRAVLQMVSIQNVITHVSSNYAAFPALASRGGQKYLREVWKQCEQLAGGAS